MPDSVTQSYADALDQLRGHLLRCPQLRDDRSHSGQVMFGGTRWILDNLVTTE